MATDAKIRISAEDKTRRAFLSVNKSMKGMSKGVFGVKTQILSLVGAAGIGALVKSSLNAADVIGKTADKLGITTDALQEYRFAAEQTGVANNTLDTSIQRFARRLGEAQQGTGVLKPALDQLGISLTDAEGKFKTTEQVLAEFSDGVKAAKNPNEQLALTVKAFDQEGAKLINLLRLGSTGINTFRKEAEELGIVLDERLIRNSEKANDKLSILAQVLKVNLTSAIVELAPQIQGMTSSLIGLSKAAAKYFGGINALNGEELVAEIERIQTRLVEVRATLADKLDADGSLKDRITDALLPSEETLEAKIVALEAKLLEADMRLGQVNLNKITNQDDPVSGGASGPTVEDQKAAEKLALEEENDRQRLAAKFERLNNSLLSEQERLRLDMEEREFIIEEAFQQGLATEAERKNQLLAIEQEFNDRKVAIAEETERRKINAISQTFGTLAVLTASSSKKLFNIGKAASIVSAVINTHQAVTKTMAATPAPWNIPLAAAQAAAGFVHVQSIRSQQFSGARELGGDVTKGRSYLVGERRPEIFVPNQSGTILPDASAAGGNNITLAPVIYAYDADTFKLQEDRIFNSMRNKLIDWMHEEGFSFAG